MSIAEKTLDILEAVLNHGSEINLEDLAKATGTSIRTTQRFVAILIKRGYLYQSSRGSPYALGIKFLQFGNAVNVAINIKEKTYPFLKKLCDVTGETALIAVLNGLMAINIATIVPKHVLRVAPDLGAVNEYPLHSTSLGKIFLASMTDKTIETILRNTEFKAYTDKTITDPIQLKQVIEVVKHDDVAFDDEEYLRGIRSVAAPISSSDGKVIATVCVVSPTIRLSKNGMRQLVPLVKSCAIEMSKSLGYRGE